MGGPGLVVAAEAPNDGEMRMAASTGRATAPISPSRLTEPPPLVGRVPSVSTFNTSNRAKESWLDPRAAGGSGDLLNTCQMPHFGSTRSADRRVGCRSQEGRPEPKAAQLGWSDPAISVHHRVRRKVARLLPGSDPAATHGSTPLVGSCRWVTLDTQWHADINRQRPLSVGGSWFRGPERPVVDGTACREPPCGVIEKQPAALTISVASSIQFTVGRALVQRPAIR